MVKCSAYRCQNATYNKTPGLTFHRFPKDESLRKAWIENMKLQDWQPNSTSLLCSKHFEKHLFDVGSCRTRLRSQAIPTLFDELLFSSQDKENQPILSPPRKRTASETVIPLLTKVQNTAGQVASTATIADYVDSSIF